MAEYQTREEKRFIDLVAVVFGVLKMYVYITGIFSGDIDFETFNRIGTKYALELVPCNNFHIVSTLQAEERYFLNRIEPPLEETSLGGRIELQKIYTERLEKYRKELEKMKKKGLSREKIERWKEVKQPLLRRETWFSGYERRDCETWSGFIRDVFEKTEVKSFGLMYRYYNESPEKERFEISNRFLNSYREAETKFMFSMLSDSLYVFDRQTIPKKTDKNKHKRKR